jgi:hypothetical protein
MGETGGVDAAKVDFLITYGVADQDVAQGMNR